MRKKQITSTRRPIIYPSGKIIAHDKRYLTKEQIIKKYIFLPAIALFYIFISTTLLIDFFSHIIIEEEYTDTVWQYILIAFISLFYIYGVFLMYKNKNSKLHETMIGTIVLIFIIYMFLNRQTIVVLHLLSDKKPYTLKTQITEVVSEDVMRRGAWKEVRIKNYSKPFNTIYVFKGNRYLTLYKGQNIYIHGLKSKFGFTYLDFKYTEDNKTLEEK